MPLMITRRMPLSCMLNLLLLLCSFANDLVLRPSVRVSVCVRARGETGGGGGGGEAPSSSIEAIFILKLHHSLYRSLALSVQ